jgi:hypothetical protein
MRPDGNRYALGRGSLPSTEPIDIELEGRPSWVVSAAVGNDSIWVVVLDDGRTQAFRLSGRRHEPTIVEPDRLPPGMPPLLLIINGTAKLAVPPTDGGSRLTERDLPACLH